MASTYSNLKFELIGTGDQSGAWGTTTNTNLGTAIEQAIVGMATISSGFVANSLTLTLTDTNAAQNARALVLNLTQALSGAGTLNVPAIQKPYMIINATGQTVTVKVTGLTGVAVPNNTRAFLYNNGTDVGSFFNYAPSLTLGTDLAVADGGTGASCASSARTNLGLGTIATQAASSVSITGGSITGITDLAVADGGTGASTACGARTNLGLGTIATQAASSVSITGGSITGITDLAVADGGTGASSAPVARTNLGATTVGGNLFTLTNPSAITFVRINADNTVSALPAACFRTAIGAGTGSGSVTSVATSGSINGLTLTGGPITGSGTITLGGGVNVSTITTGTLPVANGGTGITTTTAYGVLTGGTTSTGNFQNAGTGTSGQVLTSNGPAALPTWQAAGGGANIQTFTAGGTYTKPPGAKFVYVEMWGAGAGGGANSVSVPVAKSGGGGGGYVYRMFAAPAVGATETVTIGAGGVGGIDLAPAPTNRCRGAGGNTNFGTLLYAFGAGAVAGCPAPGSANMAIKGGAVMGGVSAHRLFNKGMLLVSSNATLTSAMFAINMFNSGSSNFGINQCQPSGPSSQGTGASFGMYAGGSAGYVGPYCLAPQLCNSCVMGSGAMSFFGGGGGASAWGCPAPFPGLGPANLAGGAGRVYGQKHPFNGQGGCSTVKYNTYRGGGGTPTNAAADFNGGGALNCAGASGPNPCKTAGSATIAGGGGSVRSYNSCTTPYGIRGGNGGNGYVIVYTW